MERLAWSLPHSWQRALPVHLHLQLFCSPSYLVFTTYATCKRRLPCTFKGVCALKCHEQKACSTRAVIGSTRNAHAVHRAQVHGTWQEAQINKSDELLRSTQKQHKIGEIAFRGKALGKTPDPRQYWGVCRRHGCGEPPQHSKLSSKPGNRLLNVSGNAIVGHAVWGNGAAAFYGATCTTPRAVSEVGSQLSHLMELQTNMSTAARL